MAERRSATPVPRGALIDLDGVLYEGERVVEGARDAIAWLVDQDIPHLFLTNTTSRPRAAIHHKLQQLGFASGAEAILTPPLAAAQWLRDHGLERAALFLPEATRDEFDGFEMVSGEDHADAVVVGDLGAHWDFATLNRAFRLLMATPQPRLLALGMTRYWRAEDGLRLDTAPFVVALSHARGARPVTLGKPARAFFEAALEHLGIAAVDAIMVGDDIRSDIRGAQDAGLRALLVRTGKFRPLDLEDGPEPDAVLDSIADLPDWWRSQTR